MSRAALLWLALAALVAAPGVVRSGADFTAGSASPANAFTAAADFNTVAVTMTDPGTPLRGTVALHSTATSERGIDRVRYESSPAGAGTWTTACQATSAPFTCQWDTTSLSGSRDLRAVALDLAGYERTSTIIASRIVDNTLPSVTFADPDAWLEGIETLSISGLDAHSGIATMAIDHRPAGGGAWTTLCSGPGTPRTCPLDTTTLADGPHELRGRATDGAGNERIGATVTRTVDNAAPTVTMTDPGSMSGTVALAAAAADGAGTGVASVRYEWRQGGGWTTACTAAAAPFTCSWDTTARTDGLYELRAVATDGAGHTGASASLTGRAIDNTAPATPTLTNPGATVQGAAALSGTASDGSGGVTWIVQYRTAGGGTWTDACSDATSPYGCTWATTGVADALYDLRALSRDAAGNETSSAELTDVRVDNNGPVLAFPDPGSLLRATVNLIATASDPAGVQSVVFERSPAGAGTWTEICTDAATPFTCAWSTASLADGSYDLRARATDTVGHASEVVVAARQVDNTAPIATALDSGNGGGGPGVLAAGDWVRFTWSEPVVPATISTGWDGSAVLPIRVEVMHHPSGKDQMDFYNAGGSVRLNLIDTVADLKLNADFVASTAWFDGTLTRSGNSLTVTLGAKTSGTVNTTAAGPVNMTWKPSALVTDLAGNPAGAGMFTEAGGLDRDF